MKAANTDLMLSATEGLIASTTGPVYSGIFLCLWDTDMFGLSGGFGFTGILDKDGVVEVLGGSFTSFKLSRETSIDVVDI